MIDFDLIMLKHEEFRRRQRAADTARERATDTSVKLTGMPHGGSGGNTNEKLMLEVAAASEALEITRKELIELKKPLRRKMKKLTKWQHVDVIRKRYLEGKAVSVVADEIGYEIRQTTRFISEAKDIINGETGEKNVL